MMNSKIAALDHIGGHSALQSKQSSPGGCLQISTANTRTMAAKAAIITSTSAVNREVEVVSPSSLLKGSKALAIVPTAPGTSEPILDEGFFALMTVPMMGLEMSAWHVHCLHVGGFMILCDLNSLSSKLVN